MNVNVRDALQNSLPWRAGRYFNVGMSLVRARVSGPAVRFRALNTAGDLAPVESPPAWTFHLGLAAKPTRPVSAARTDGFFIQFSWDGRVCQALAAIVAPGVLAGITDAPIIPTLFSATHDVHRSGLTEWISTENQHVVLIRRTEEALQRFVLAVGGESHAAVMNRAHTAFSVDPQALFEEGARWRRSVFSRLQNTPFGTDTLCMEALESLLARVELPCEQMPHVWCATEWKPQSAYDVDEMFALCSAWAVLEPSVAEDMVRATLSLQRHDGALPWRVLGGGAADYSRPPLPLAVQTVAYLSRITGHRDFARWAWPALENYLGWSLEHFTREFAPPADESAARPDPVTPPPPNERRAEQALVLLAEILALHELSQLCAVSMQGFFWTEAERLREFLESHPWIRWAVDHADETRPARPPHMSPISLLALSSTLLPESAREAIAEHWDRHIGEVEDAPGMSWSKALLLVETARRAEMPAVASKLSSFLWKKIQTEAEPMLVETRDTRAAASPMLEAGLAASVLCVSTPHTAELRRRQAAASRLMDWAEQHHFAVLAAVLFIPVALVIAGLLFSLLKPSPPASQVSLTMGLAQELYRSGHYREAIAIYEELVRRNSNIAPLQLLLGNAYYRAGDYANAEKCYRSALERSEQAPVAMLNLALTLYRQRRYEESSHLYARFIEEYESRFPDGARRAKTALLLLHQQVITNRMTTPSSVM